MKKFRLQSFLNKITQKKLECADAERISNEPKISEFRSHKIPKYYP